MKNILNIQNVIDYIENNLCKKLNVKSYVEKYGYSYSYLSKAFNTICDVSIKEYIRNRILSRAAIDLIYSNESIVNISLKYGYSSQENFCRAMKTFHLLSPSDIRKYKRSKQFNKIIITINTMGGNIIETNQTNVKNIVLSTIKQTFNGNPLQCRNEIAEFWRDSLSQQEDLYKTSKNYGALKKVYGLIKIINENTFDYYIGYETLNPIQSFQQIIINDTNYIRLTSPKSKYPTKFIQEIYSLPFLDNIDINEFIVEIYYWYLPESKITNQRFIEVMLPQNKSKAGELCKSKYFRKF